MTAPGEGVAATTVMLPTGEGADGTVFFDAAGLLLLRVLFLPAPLSLLLVAAAVVVEEAVWAAEVVVVVIVVLLVVLLGLARLLGGPPPALPLAPFTSLEAGVCFSSGASSGVKLKFLELQSLREDGLGLKDNLLRVSAKVE